MIHRNKAPGALEGSPVSAALRWEGDSHGATQQQASCSTHPKNLHSRGPCVRPTR